MVFVKPINVEICLKNRLLLLGFPIMDNTFLFSYGHLSKIRLIFSILYSQRGDKL